MTDTITRRARKPENKIYGSAYYLANRERILETSRKWQEENHARQMFHLAMYYAANGDKMKEYQRTRMKTNPEAYAKQMERMKLTNEKRKASGKAQEYSKAYYAANREKILQYQRDVYAKKKNNSV